ncbi:MAG: hypothetical protein QXH07_01220 [Thermoplasmata archaeon]
MPINPMQKYITLGISVLLIIAIGGVSTIISFIYLGFVVAIIFLFLTFAGGLAIILKFLVKRVPADTFMEAIATEAKLIPRQVIIRDPKNKNFIYFNEKGDLVRTQYGTFFFYGHPFINPKKVLIINSLNSKEVEYPSIIIDGRLEYHGRELYVETMHPLYVKNNKLSYEDIKLSITADDLLQNMGDFVKQVFMVNPKNLDRKTKPSEISEMLPDEQ